MAKPQTIGNMIAPPRFLAFIAMLIAGTGAGVYWLHGWALKANGQPGRRVAQTKLAPGSTRVTVLSRAASRS